ncbi:unnamed protein product [Rangifer tarandus platyrhynchus]|uniref:Uncharacterized protein n=2 Tax=Rangifer tarandus platyrhynchus TaxID=3082113 RepID=A0ABN8XWU0_RANTA|nr:unnamed protein product [Rangifer tarandus platyrhynchus]
MDGPLQQDRRIRDREREYQQGRSHKIFDNLITFTVFSWLGATKPQPTLKGRRLHKGRNTWRQRSLEPCQNLPIIAGLHRTSYTSIFPDAFNYLPVALRDTGHNSLDQNDAWGSALLDAVTQVV